MKKIRRDRALRELFSRLESRDFDRRENALFELAVMLGRANIAAGGVDALSAAELPRELSRIRLTPDEQRDIGDRLARLVVRYGESRASAIWTLGAATAQAGWEPVSILLRDCGHQLESEAAYQACSALRVWLESGELADELVQSGSAACDLPSLLRNWSGAGDMRLRSAALDLMEKMNAAAE